MKSTSLKTVLIIITVGTATACATIGDQRGQAPTETETERFFRQQDEASRYAR